MKKFTLTLLTAVLSMNAFAIYDPSYERPLLSANMQMSEAFYTLEEASNVKLTLHSRDGVDAVTALSISYSLPSSLRDNDTFLNMNHSMLSVEDVMQDECGSTVYYAYKGDETGARESLRLVDHSTRQCEDYRPFRWEAHYRVGFGWCGTMDSTMSLMGNPEFVFSIQQL